MQPTVRTFNDNDLKKALKNCPEIVQRYVEAQQKIIENDKIIINKAIRKLKGAK